MRSYDRAHLLHRSRKVRVFQNQTATDIVKKVVAENGLRFEGDASGDPHDYIGQDNETDWDFIWRLAEPLRIRVHRERPDGQVPPARPRRHRRARVARDADVVLARASPPCSR